MSLPGAPGRMSGSALGRYTRRQAHRCFFEGRTASGCQPGVALDEVVVLAETHAPSLLRDPTWFKGSRASQLDRIATEMLRLDRQAQSEEAGMAINKLAREGDHHLSLTQAILRLQREIPFPNITIVAEAILSRRQAWISGRVLDPPNGGGWRPYLQYYIRWKDKTVFPDDLIPRGHP